VSYADGIDTNEKNMYYLRYALLMKVFSAWPGLLKTFAPIKRSLRTLWNVFLTFCFVLLIGSITGLGFFTNTLHNRCVPKSYMDMDIFKNRSSTENERKAALAIPDIDICYAGLPVADLENRPDFLNYIYIDDPLHKRNENVCSLIKNMAWSKYSDCPAITGDNSTQCVETDRAPLNDHLSYNNIAAALLYTFLMMSSLMWGKPTAYLMATTSGLSFIYSLVLVVLGTILLLNLVLVVVIAQYEYEVRLEKEKKREETVADMLLAPAFGEDYKKLVTIPLGKVCGGNKQQPAEENGLKKMETTIHKWLKAALDFRWQWARELLYKPEDRNNDTKEIRPNYPTLKFGWLLVVAILVVGNTIAFAFDHYCPGGCSAYEARLEVVYEVFLWCFVVEMACKMLASGLRYFLNVGNLFDCTVTVVSLALLFVDKASYGFEVVAALRALRCFRLLSVNPTCRDFLSVLGNKLLKAWPFVLLVFYTIAVISVVATTSFRDVFQNSYSPACPDQMSFKTVWESFVNSLISMAGLIDSSLWLAMDSSTTPSIALFYVAIAVFGYYLILSLFIAVLFEFFQDWTIRTEKNDKSRYDDLATDAKEWWKGVVKSAARIGLNLSRKKKIKKTNAIKGSHWIRWTGFVNTPGDESIHGNVSSSPSSPVKDTNSKERADDTGASPDGKVSKNITCNRNKANLLQAFVHKLHPYLLDKKYKGVLKASQKPMYSQLEETLDKKGNKFDRFVYSCLDDSRWKWCMVTLIVANAITTAFAHPGNSEETKWLIYCFELFFLSILTCDLALRLCLNYMCCREGRRRSCVLCNLSPFECEEVQGKLPEKLQAFCDNAKEKIQWCLDTKTSRYGYLFNLLDLTVIILSILGTFLAGPTGISFFYFLMSGLRPLLLFTKLESLRKTLREVFDILTEKELLILLSVLVCCMLSFGIIGVQLFKGRLDYCNFSKCDGNYVTEKIHCNGTAPPIPPNTEGNDCVWIQSPWNYDNLWEAIISLFIMLTGSGFTEGIRAPWYSLGNEEQPNYPGHPAHYNYTTQDKVRSNNLTVLKALYLYGFSIFVWLILGNLFISYILAKYQQQMKKKGPLTGHLAENETEWAQMHHFLLTFKPRKTEDGKPRIPEEDKSSLTRRFRQYAFRVTVDATQSDGSSTGDYDEESQSDKSQLSSKGSTIIKESDNKREATGMGNGGRKQDNDKFEIMEVSVIVLTFIVMATRHWGASDTWNAIIFYFLLTASMLHFTKSMVRWWACAIDRDRQVKLFGMHIKIFSSTFFYKGWNIYDLVVAIASFIGILVFIITQGLVPDGYFIGFLYMTRVLGLLRLIQYMDGVKRILRALLLAWTRLRSALLLMLGMIYVFAVLGVWLFYGTYPKESLGFNYYYNFNSTISAMMMLTVVATLDDWENYMFDTEVQYPMCDGPGTCGTPYASIYFIVFVTIIYYLLINLTIAILVDFYEMSLKFPSGLPEFQLCKEDPVLLWKQFSSGWKRRNEGFRNEGFRNEGSYSKEYMDENSFKKLMREGIDFTDQENFISRMMSGAAKARMEKYIVEPLRYIFALKEDEVGTQQQEEQPKKEITKSSSLSSTSSNSTDSRRSTTKNLCQPQSEEDIDKFWSNFLNIRSLSQHQQERGDDDEINIHQALQVYTATKLEITPPASTKRIPPGEAQLGDNEIGRRENFRTLVTKTDKIYGKKEEKKKDRKRKGTPAAAADLDPEKGMYSAGPSRNLSKNSEAESIIKDDE